jgi:integrase
MGKRADGEGTIRHRKDGRWEGRFYDRQGGREIRRTLYGTTQAEVSASLRATLARRDRDGFLPSGRETVGSYLRTWLDSVRPSVRPRSWERYEEHVRLHLVPALGRHTLTRLTPAHVSRAYGELLAGGLSASTVRRAHATLHRALGQAVAWRIVGTNIADVVDAPRPRRREMSALSPTQARELLAAAAGDRLEALYVLAVTAGLRQGELLAIHWRDVNLDEGWLHVVGSLYRSRETGLSIGEPKTGRSRRRVELTPTAIDALRRHKAAAAETRLAAGEWVEHDLVFCGPRGSFLGAAGVLRRFRRLLAVAGLPPVRFHDLRHTAATLMLGRGVHPKIVSEMLGHSTVSITLDLYSHVSETMQREAVLVMDDLLRSR